MTTNIRTFHVSKLGASHIKSGKPCQDSSGEWQSDDRSVSIVVTADGHGGDTYVRSDVGSQLAVKITMERLREAINNPALLPLLKGRKGAVTARPDGQRRLPKNQNDWSETQFDLVRQDQTFARQVHTLKEQDEFFQRLFSDIYNDWMDAITHDSDEKPFTADEKAHLGQNRIAKAYGTTLLAFVRTPLYWFAFHLGDGKMLAADATGAWTEPVPWDCNCFLNFTTSLCNNNPLPSFRWAFDGTGSFPTAVILGSDGLDDSWGTMDKLKAFYTKILGIIQSDTVEGVALEQTIHELGDYLTKLSAQGSRDDMTMAGILDMDGLDILCQLAELRQQGNLLRNERDKRNQSFTESQKQAEDEISKLNDELENKIMLFRRQAEQEIKDREAQIRQDLEIRRQQMEEENAATRVKYEELRRQADILKGKAMEREMELKSYLANYPTPETPSAPENTEPSEPKDTPEVFVENQNTEESPTVSEVQEVHEVEDVPEPHELFENPMPSWRLTDDASVEASIQPHSEGGSVAREIIIE